MSTEVETYLRAVPAERIARMRQLHELIVALYPNATVDMSYRMPTYRVGEGWVALANQKGHVSLYTCGEHHLERFRKRHPKIGCGKGCIRFRDRDELPLADLEQVIRHAIDHPKP